MSIRRSFLFVRYRLNDTQKSKLQPALTCSPMLLQMSLLSFISKQKGFQVMPSIESARRMSGGPVAILRQVFKLYTTLSQHFLPENQRRQDMIRRKR